MKKLVFGLIATVMFGGMSYGQTELENKYQREFSFEENNVKINYKALVKENHLIFNISIEDLSFHKSINEAFDINLDSLTFSKDIANLITSKQVDLSANFNPDEIKNLVNVMDKMVDKNTEKLTIDELKDIKTQGLFISNSLIKSINRLILKNSQILFKSTEEQPVIYVANTVYEGFDRGMTSFILEQDLEVGVLEFINYINQNPGLAKEKGVYFLKGILENKNFKKITFAELQDDIRKYTTEHPSEFEGEAHNGFRWPSGSSHGCCGNYSGRCWYWHVICYAHDEICTNCTPRWFCFSGCRPD